MSAPKTVWTPDRLADPHALPDKAQRVQEMFARIARWYDLNNRLHSLWRDQAWRRQAVKAAAVRQGQAVLDIATGTGDLAGLFARRTPAARVAGLDFCQDMLDVALAKFPRCPIEWFCGNAMNLPFADQSFHVASMAFGLRNVASPQRALAQMHRVLRPGGRAVVLEFASPHGPLGRLLGWYVDTVMPATAGRIAHDRAGAYRYLSASVKTFLSAAELAEAMRQAGFADVRSREMTLGLAMLHVGVKP